MRDHITKIQSSLEQIRKSLSALDMDNDLEELLKIIHQPGWTTPAEAILFHGLADATLRAVEHVGVMKQALLEGGRQVSVG